MDILTIGEVLIDLTQTGKDARGIPQFAANPGGAGGTDRLYRQGGCRCLWPLPERGSGREQGGRFRHGGGCRPSHHHGSRVSGCHRRAGFQLLPQRQR